MKNLLQSLLLATAGLFGTIPVQAATTFSLETASSQIQVGDYFDVDVVVHDLFASDATDELLAFGLNTISSNAALLQLTGSSINPLFSDDSVSLGLDGAGSAFPAIVNDAAVANSFGLATLHFHALAAGNVSLTIASDLADANQGLIFLNQVPLAIAANRSLAITAVPLPSGLLLFVSGLAMSLGAFRKRKA
jgi:hypothetical protein